MKNKICTKCKCTKSVDSFHKKKGKPRAMCKLCFNEYQRNFRLNNREKLLFDRRNAPSNSRTNRRIRNLRYKYNITIEDYNKMFTVQNGKCFICDSPPEENDVLCVDHCHESGNVRKLLCRKCNKALGLFNDDLNVIKKAFIYIQTHKNEVNKEAKKSI